MSRITLVRHGRPTVSLREWVSGRSLMSFIDRYNAAGIASDSFPPAETQEAIANLNWVITSDYVRTQDSAIRLNLSVDYSDAQYREVNCWINFPMPLPLPVLLPP